MICFIYFGLFLFFSLLFFVIPLNFLILDFTVILEYSIFSINRTIVLITILLDWISLLFMRFVLFISSIVIFYRNEYI